MIDTHCHFDMMDNPETYIKGMSQAGHTIIGMTNCPKHFEVGSPIVRQYPRIRLALGFHPQVVDQIQSQLKLFDKFVDTTTYIGEIGMDFSKRYESFKAAQLKAFEYICQLLSGKKKIISIHSTKAEAEILQIIERFSIKTPILHWYSGPLNLIPKALDLGCYFSINESMTLTQKGRMLIKNIPTDRILTESDAPFNRHVNIGNALRNMNLDESIIASNFRALIATLK